MTILCTKISDTVGQLFPCERKGDFMVLQPPFLYPDGIASRCTLNLNKMVR